MIKKERKANKLARSASPYLLQHAYNPVNWYPWGSEALAKAKSEDKPILVSIGYSACHWCHVMEHESFENDQTADLMNKNFVCIKIDREERPDIDNIYMEAIQAMGLQGGWPLNVFLTPEQKPFYGGTYFPKSGWQQLLQSVAEAFEKNREKLEESAEKFRETLVLDEVTKYQLDDFIPGIDKVLISASTDKLTGKLDPVFGGIKKAPKFPMPSIWFLMFRQYFLTKEKKYLDAATLTLDKMSRGGIYDHLEGGFARYSVDDKWFAPHFEKMLYDNGQLLSLYSEGFMLTKKSSYKAVIDKTIDWMKTNMLSPMGGFYSALDADSEGVEGKYYVWEAQEIDALLGEKSHLFKSYFDVKESGNWEKGVNILYNSKDLKEFVASNEISEQDWKEHFEECRRILLDARSKRIKPGLDNKILAGWNGMALTGIVKAYQATGNENYIGLATFTAEFIRDHLIKKDGKIIRVYGSQISGVLEDYAFIIDGYINLYQSNFNMEWLELALKLTGYTMDNFHDKENGMFFFTDSNDHDLIARKKEIFDNVIPSSNSQMAENLRRLGLLMENQQWTDLSMKMVLQVKKFLKNDVEYMANWACTYLAFIEPAAEIAIVGPDLKSMSLDLHSNYYPFKLVAGDERQNDVLPLLKDRHPIDGRTTLYVCFDKACKLPVHSIEEALNQLPGLESTGI